MRIFYNMLGSLYEVNKDITQAEANYKKAIEINPNIAGFHGSLAIFYIRQNMADKAIKEYNAALQKAPDSLPALMGLGIIYDTQKKYDKCKGVLSKGFKN